ncbi:hypothetical protein [Lentzea californiensis]|uniref:hypothetical protein n=1 Tax=Lentzea californiensis TaxID=438851 RepID=UPI002165B0C0|nr:hypothetical protein [Lentzea californiensis]MCR3752624.1 Leucine Rich Repeat [Lentzea californiensis]
MDEEIARALRGTPSTLAFRALCAAVTRSGEDLLAWCEEQLASWPDETRQAPYPWIAALEAGFIRPVWPLVRSLDLGSGVRQGMRALALPDPRTCAEVRAVTDLKLAPFGHRQVAAFAETADHWRNLRSVEVAGLWEFDAEPMARFAASDAVARLESLTVVRVRESLWGLDNPPLRIERPTGLKHAGLLADDLLHLLRNGFAPDLTSVTVLVRSVGEASELAGFEGLAALERLEIGFRCGKDAVEQDEIASEEFFSRARLTNLRSLTVHGSHLNRGGARGLIAAEAVLRQLTELTLADLPGGDDVIALVLGATDAAIIEKLALTGLVATDRSADAFAAEYPRLRHLDLNGNYLGPAGVRKLLAARLPVLEHLDLGCVSGTPHYSRARPQPIGDAGAQAVARHKGLKRLNLAATGLTPAGLRSVLELPLEFLDVSSNPLGDLPSLPAAPA